MQRYKVSIIIVTYRRSWALPSSLSSLKDQNHLPDEVIVVLKPSGDNSEEIIDEYSSYLNIKLIIQKGGNVTDAYSLGIENARGDIIAFLDDDAIAEEQWIEKYLSLFEKLPDAGGIGGIVYKALMVRNHRIIKTNQRFYEEKTTSRGPHRKPLLILEGYGEFISDSGFPARLPSSAPIIKSMLLSGVNMAYRKKALKKVCLAEVYGESRVGNLFEQYLALCARLRNYNVYRIIDPNISPIVWHMCHSSSLQRTPLKSEFQRNYDLAYNYWRIKYLRLKTSFSRYLLGLALTSRKNPNIKLPAYAYGFIRGAIFYYKNRARNL